MPPDSPAPPQQGGAPPGGGTLPPQGAAGAQQPSALGQEAMARAQLKLIVHALHTKIFPAFTLNSDEGKAVQKALNALAPYGGGGEKDGGKNDAMSALMARAMAAKGGAGGAPGMAQPNRGPVPSTTGGGQ